MSKDLKNIYLLTQADLKKIRRLVRILEKALLELAELKRVTTFDDMREHYQPSESDLAEEASFIEYQLDFFPDKRLRGNDF